MKGKINVSKQKWNSLIPNKHVYMGGVGKRIGFINRRAIFAFD